MDRKQGAEQLKKQAIKFLMRFEASRELSEECFNKYVERYKKQFISKDEYSPTIRAANEILFGGGMLDHILTKNEIDFLLS